MLLNFYNHPYAKSNSEQIFIGQVLSSPPSTSTVQNGKMHTPSRQFSAVKSCPRPPQHRQFKMVKCPLPLANFHQSSAVLVSLNIDSSKWSILLLYFNRYIFLFLMQIWFSVMTHAVPSKGPEIAGGIPYTGKKSIS